MYVHEFDGVKELSALSVWRLDPETYLSEGGEERREQREEWRRQEETGGDRRRQEGTGGERSIR